MFSLFATLKRKKDGHKKEDKTLIRLPKNACPSHYTVCFKPFMEENEFEASVAIDIELVENSKQIVVNAQDLTFTKMIWEEDETKNRQEPVDMRSSDRGQTSFIFDPYLIPQKGQLRLNFKGVINDKKMTGFYKDKFNANDTACNLITQFEPSEARRCFPCFDEPHYKASFDLCLVVPKGQVSISNMPIKAQYDHKKNAHLEIIEFKRTPPMPTYALAIVNGKFDYIEGRSKDNSVPIKIYTCPGKKQQGAFALEIASNALSFFAAYLNCPYPLQKLDLIALGDFSLNAVESWGIIMFQESQLLLDKDVDAACRDKQHVALIICEEISMQWLGNLISIDWWNQLWIKEAIATFLRYLCMEEIRPDFECSTHFVTEIVQGALKADAFKSTHPPEMQVHSAHETEELFDVISFKKGAALIRMLYNYIGEEHFKNGLRNYVEKFKFKNAVSEDLWKCLEFVSNKPVQMLMNSWMTQKGYPWLKVTAKQDGKHRYLKITQEKFMYDQTARDPRADGIWIIPLTVTSSRDPASVIFHTQIESKQNTIVIPDCGKSDWLKINPGVVGFYRVKYATSIFKDLVFAIRNKKMEPVDRLNILDDQFAFLLSGVGSTIDVLTLMEAYVEDEDYNVWCTISVVFDKLLKTLAYLNFDDSVRKFGRYIFHRIYDKFMGHKFHSDEHHHTKLLRSLVFRMMAKFRHNEAMRMCHHLFENFWKHGQEIPPDIHFAVYEAMLSKCDDDVLRQLIKMYQESSSVEDKLRISNAFGGVTDSTQIRHILEFSTSNDVHKQDVINIFTSISKNKVGRDASWVFFKENFTFFKNRYGTTLASKLVKGITEDFATDDKIQEINDFFKINPYPGTERAVQLAVENIFISSSWLKRERNPAALKEYLEADAT